MSVLESKYHLPHNAIRVDEFEYMLSIIDLNKEYYLYYDLKMLILQCQIRDDKLKIFHPAYHNNLLNHPNKLIRMIYQNCIDLQKSLMACLTKLLEITLNFSPF